METEQEARSEEPRKDQDEKKGPDTEDAEGYGSGGTWSQVTQASGVNKP